MNPDRRSDDSQPRVPASLRISLGAVTMSSDSNIADPAGAWILAYGSEDDGAVLVRPDGHVAWSGAARPQPELDFALRVMLRRSAGSR